MEIKLRSDAAFRSTSIILYKIIICTIDKRFTFSVHSVVYLDLIWDVHIHFYGTLLAQVKKKKQKNKRECTSLVIYCLKRYRDG